MSPSRWIARSLSIIGLFALTACGGGGGSSPASTGETPAPLVVKQGVVKPISRAQYDDAKTNPDGTVVAIPGTIDLKDGDIFATSQGLYKVAGLSTQSSSTLVTTAPVLPSDLLSYVNIVPALDLEHAKFEPDPSLVALGLENSKKRPLAVAPSVTTTYDPEIGRAGVRVKLSYDGTIELEFNVFPAMGAIKLPIDPVEINPNVYVKARGQFKLNLSPRKKLSLGKLVVPMAGGLADVLISFQLGFDSKAKADVSPISIERQYYMSFLPGTTGEVTSAPPETPWSLDELGQALGLESGREISFSAGPSFDVVMNVRLLPFLEELGHILGEPPQTPLVALFLRAHNPWLVSVTAGECLDDIASTHFYGRLSAEAQLKVTGGISELLSATTLFDGKMAEWPLFTVSKESVCEEPPTAYRLSTDRAALDPGARTFLNVQAFDKNNVPRQVLAKSVAWSSSDPSVAVVNEGTGEVTAISPGATTIHINSRSDKKIVAEERIVVLAPGAIEIVVDGFLIADRSIDRGIFIDRNDQRADKYGTLAEVPARLTFYIFLSRGVTTSDECSSWFEASGLFPPGIEATVTINGISKSAMPTGAPIPNRTGYATIFCTAGAQTGPPFDYSRLLGMDVSVDGYEPNDGRNGSARLRIRYDGDYPLGSGASFNTSFVLPGHPTNLSGPFPTYASFNVSGSQNDYYDKASGLMSVATIVMHPH